MKFDGRTIDARSFFKTSLTLTAGFIKKSSQTTDLFNDPRCKYVTLHVNGNARTDGVGVSSGGRDVNTRCPLARPST